MKIKKSDEVHTFESCRKSPIHASESFSCRLGSRGMLSATTPTGFLHTCSGLITCSQRLSIETFVMNFRTRLHFRASAAIFDHTVRGSFPPPHIGCATQDHARAPDSSAAQDSAKDIEANQAHYQGTCARVAARPEGRASPPHWHPDSDNLVQSSRHLPAMDSADRC